MCADVGSFRKQQFGNAIILRQYRIRNCKCPLGNRDTDHIVTVKHSADERATRERARAGINSHHGRAGIKQTVGQRYSRAICCRRFASPSSCNEVDVCTSVRNVAKCPVYEVGSESFGPGRYESPNRSASATTAIASSGVLGPGLFDAQASRHCSVTPTAFCYLLRRLARPSPLRLSRLFQHRSQELARIAPRRLRDVLRRAPRHDLAAAVAAFGP